MSVEENKAAVRRAIEAINARDVAALEALSDPPVRATARPTIEGIYATWGDHHADITDMVAEGDRVWARLATSGGHTAEFEGIPPTGKRWTNTGVVFFRFENGKIVESDTLFDVMNHIKQLGATITAPGGTATTRR